MMDGVLCTCCGFLCDSNESLITHLKTQTHEDWVTRMNTYPRLLSEYMVVPDGHCINAKDRTYYYTLAQLGDAANAQCAQIGLLLICEDCSGIYMSSRPLQLDYERTKDMPLEEKPSKLTDSVWKIPKAACKVLPCDYGGGNDVEDSDGEEIEDLKTGTVCAIASCAWTRNYRTAGKDKRFNEKMFGATNYTLRTQ